MQTLGVAFGSIVTEMGRPLHVCFPPDSDRTADIAGKPETYQNRTWGILARSQLAGMRVKKPMLMAKSKRALVQENLLEG